LRHYPVNKRGHFHIVRNLGKKLKVDPVLVYKRRKGRWKKSRLHVPKHDIPVRGSPLTERGVRDKG